MFAYILVLWKKKKNSSNIYIKWYCTQNNSFGIGSNAFQTASFSKMANKTLWISKCFFGLIYIISCKWLIHFYMEIKPRKKITKSLVLVCLFTYQHSWNTKYATHYLFATTVRDKQGKKRKLEINASNRKTSNHSMDSIEP